jgi:hypothetical protein
MSTSATGMPIPQDALDKMPLAQRAKIEESLRARAGKVNTNTSRTCITKEDLDRGDLMTPEEANCKRNVIAQSARHLEVEETCGAPKASKTLFKFDAKSSESYAATVDRVANQGKVHMEMAGRWLATTCTDADND